MFGFRSSGTCPDFKSFQLSDLANISRPTVVGMATQNLAPTEENIVDITISMSGALPYSACAGGAFRLGSKFKI